MKRLTLSLFLFPFAALAADVPATLQWSQRVELSPRVSGIVQEVNADVGAQVKKGDALVVLDGRIYQARLAESEAALRRQREDAADARRDLKRTQELYDRTVISISELEQAKVKSARTGAQVNELSARIAQDRRNLEDATLRAPFDALVVARMAEPGQNVVVGLQPQPLLVLARSGEMVARAYLPQEGLRGLQVGQSVTVGAAGKSYTGRVKSVGLEPLKLKDAIVYQVDVLIPTQDVLRAGTPAVLKLP